MCTRIREEDAGSPKRFLITPPWDSSMHPFRLVSEPGRYLSSSMGVSYMGLGDLRSRLERRDVDILCRPKTEETQKQKLAHAA